MWEKLVDGEVYQTEAHQIGDLKALPFPDYDVFPGKTGSGCKFFHFWSQGETGVAGYDRSWLPYRCTYCCNTPILEGWRSKKEFLRKYEPEAMVAELERLRDEYDVGYFEFWDELFLSDLKFVRAFLEIYKERIGLPFSINSRVEVMNEEFARLLPRPGVTRSGLVSRAVMKSIRPTCSVGK